MATNDLSANAKAANSRNLMIFVLVLSLSGLENLIAELIPELEIGLLEVGISNFFFVPLALAVLFNSWWAAFAAPIGEILFSDLLLGEFGGLSEMEEVFLTAFGLFLAARIVRNPKNAMQVLFAGLIGYGVMELAGTFIDIFKVLIGVEELEAVEGLPQSIFVLEGIDFAIEFIISGIILGAIPAMTLVPRLHGKIEPLMGLEPRRADEPTDPKADRMLVLIGIAALVIATALAVGAEMGLNALEWEPEFLESVGEWFIYVPLVLAALVASGVILIRIGKKPQNS